jgi:hypothetical protein
LDVFVLVHPAEITVPFRAGISDVLETFLQARLVDIRETHQIDIAELLEIAHVLFADQTEPDEPDADAVIRAKDPFVLCGRQGGGTQELSPGGLDRFQFIQHLLLPLRAASLPRSRIIWLSLSRLILPVNQKLNIRDSTFFSRE